MVLDQVFQQLIKLLHKGKTSLKVSACNLTIIEKSTKFGSNGSPTKQFNIELYKDPSLGINFGVSKHIGMCEEVAEVERSFSCLGPLPLLDRELDQRPKSC